MHAAKNRRLLDQDHGLPSAPRADRRSDSRRRPADDYHVIMAIGGLDRKESFTRGLCLKAYGQL